MKGQLGYEMCLLIVPEPPAACFAAPGSRDKIELMRFRFEMGVGVLHPNDLRLITEIAIHDESREDDSWLDDENE